MLNLFKRQFSTRGKTLDVIQFSTPVDYLDAYFMQKRLRDRIASRNINENDKLIILQHSDVYTLGRRSKLSDLLFFRNRPDLINLENEILNLTKFESFSNLKSFPDTFNNALGTDFKVFKIDRGGEITYHCPGQLVAYFIFDLENNHMKDLHWLLRTLERCVQRVLFEKFNLTTTTNSDHTGVWVDSAKIAAIGLSASRWVSMHGISVNLECDLEGFKRIIPCGISDPTKTVTSVKTVLQSEAVSFHEVSKKFIDVVKAEFTFEIVKFVEQ